MTTTTLPEDADEFPKIEGDNTAPVPTTDRVRAALREAFGLTAGTDLAMMNELLSEHLEGHWIEGPGPDVTVQRWGTHPSWEMSYVGPGGAYEVVHVAAASERVDAMVVLAAERLEAQGRGIPELTVLAVDLLMHGKARVLRDADHLAQAEPAVPTGRLALPLSTEEAPGEMPEGTMTIEERDRLRAEQGVRESELLSARLTALAEGLGMDAFDLQSKLARASAMGMDVDAMLDALQGRLGLPPGHLPQYDPTDEAEEDAP